MNDAGNAPRHTMKHIFTRDLSLGFLAYLAFLTAMSAMFPTFPIFLSRLGSSEREIGVLVGVSSVSSLVSRFLAGGALTRYSEKSVMVLGAVLFALTFLAFIVFRPFWPLFVVRLLQGAAIAGIDTAALALIIKTIPPAYRGQGIGYLMLAPPLSLAIVPSLSISLINRYSFTILFLSCTALSLCSLLLSSRLKGQETPDPRRDAGSHSAVFLESKILAPAMTSFLYSAVWGAVMAFFPLYAIQCGVQNPGHFFSAVAITMITGRALGGRIVDIYSKEKLLVIFILTGMMTMIMLSVSKTLPMFIVVGLLWGVGQAIFVPASMTYAFDYAGSSGGAAVGTFRGFSDFGYAVGPAVMGIIIPITGYRIMFLCLALICFMNFCYFQFYVRKRGRAVVPA